VEKINGLVLAEMIDLGSKNLAKNAEKINALNVFPVPDGDTGTNMNLSMSSGAKETAANVVENIGELGKSFSKGLLMGARGNSGVILSQLFRGMSQHIADKKEVNAKEFAEAIQNGVSIAYKAIIKPVEGTILQLLVDYIPLLQLVPAVLFYFQQQKHFLLLTQQLVLLQVGCFCY